MFTRKFWKDLGERLIRTFAQAVGSYLTLLGLNVIQGDFVTALWGGLIAGGYAVLMALLAAFKEPELQSASFVTEVAEGPVDPPGKHAAPDTQDTPGGGADD